MGFVRLDYEAIAAKFTIVEKATDVEQIKKLETVLTEAQGVECSIPTELKELWLVGSEWHLIKDHFGVFGFNIFSPNTLITHPLALNIFGDEECKKDWMDGMSDRVLSCALPGWICIASASEYDYYFVCVNKKSMYFGATIHMVNNCFEEEIYTEAPFSNFIGCLTSDQLLKKDEDSESE